MVGAIGPRAAYAAQKKKQSLSARHPSRGEVLLDQ